MDIEQEFETVHKVLHQIIERVNILDKDFANSLISYQLNQILGDLNGAVSSIKKARDENRVRGTDRFSKELIFTFFQQAPIELAIFDPSGCYLSATDQWLSRMKANRSETIGKSIYEQYPPSQERRHLHEKALAGEFLSGFDEAFILAIAKNIFLTGLLVRLEIQLV